MGTPIQTNLELREWQKKFNPSQPLNTVITTTKRNTDRKQNNKYLQQSFFSR